jgi:hypothetical protein
MLRLTGSFRNLGFYVASSSVSNKRCGTAILVREIFPITQVNRDDEGDRKRRASFATSYSGPARPIF